MIACNFLRFGADVCAPSVGGYKPQDLFSILTAQMVRLRFIHVPLLDAINLSLLDSDCFMFACHIRCR